MILLLLEPHFTNGELEAQRGYVTCQEATLLVNRGVGMGSSIRAFPSLCHAREKLQKAPSQLLDPSQKWAEEVPAGGSGQAHCAGPASHP